MDLNRIFVAGGGFMGSGIAQTVITSGYSVTLWDLSQELVDKAADGIERMLNKSVAKGKLSQDAKNTAMARLTGTVNLNDAAEAGLVIEAVAECESIKKDLFRKLSKICDEKTVLASNTSSISIAELSSVVEHPERFIGMHFFSPVPLMKLLEIVRGVATTSETVEIARRVGEQLGKVCIVAKDRPAFIVNRMLDPMINEAIGLLEAGIGSVEDIDTGMRYGLNHPMGPLELIDMAGIDIELAVMEVLYKETGDPKYRPATLLRDMVRMGWLGRKTGKGFYIYGADGTRTSNPAL